MSLRISRNERQSFKYEWFLL